MHVGLPVRITKKKARVQIAVTASNVMRHRLPPITNVANKLGSCEDAGKPIELGTYMKQESGITERTLVVKRKT
jgi:hypothetical protein